MSKPRIELQRLIESMVGPSVKVYFQAPTKLSYPCVVYERSRINNMFANNKVYGNMKRYTLTLIYQNPDSDLPDILARIPTCYHEQHFVNDNLHHDIFSVYF